MQVIGARRTCPRTAHYVRIYGTVTPAENGMQVGILRITGGRGVLVGGTVAAHAQRDQLQLQPRDPRQRGGVYRVLVRVTNGAQVSGYSQPLLIR